MAGYETFTWNAYESTTLTNLNSGDPEVTVQSVPVGLNAPAYLVLEPDTPTKREYVLVTAIAGPVLTISRGLEGSAEGVGGGGGGHLANVKIRAIFTHQNLEDIWDAIVPPDGIEQSLLNHITDGGDPHAQAGYLTEVDSNLLYVQLDGGSQLPMTGWLRLFGDPTGQHASTAATKNYVDDAETGAVAAAKAYSDGLDHDHAGPIAVHAGVINAHHTKYTDAEAVAAVGPHFSGNHDNLTGVSTSDHHVKYSDANARAAVDNSTYLKLSTGGTVSGKVTVNSQVDADKFQINNVDVLEAAPGFTKLMNGASQIISGDGVDELYLGGVPFAVGQYAVTCDESGANRRLYYENKASARQYKTDIEPSSMVGGECLAWEPTQFRYINEGDDGPLLHWFIADDIEEMSGTHFVKYKDGEVLNTDDRAMIADMVLTIQALNERIAELENA